MGLSGVTLVVLPTPAHLPRNLHPVAAAESKTKKNNKQKLNPSNGLGAGSSSSSSSSGFFLSELGVTVSASGNSYSTLMYICHLEKNQHVNT